MFDDRTFENIIKEMLDDFSVDVRTDEGSLAYNACAKIAEKLEEVYGDMDEINDNISLLTMDLEHLINEGKERGVEYIYATAPKVKARFKQNIDIGEQFVCNGFNYEVSGFLNDFDYILTCLTEGVEANANLGSLEPVEYIDDYQGGEIIEITTLGADDEDEEVYRKRLIESKRNVAFGGNKAEYRQIVNKISGVGGCKPKRRDKTSAVINITVISDEYGVPSDEKIQEIQELVDPTLTSGEGDGLAPVCHNVKILPVTAETINVSTHITFAAGYTKSEMQTAITAAIKKYFLELCESWESKEFNNLTVRISRLEAELLTLDGIDDVENTTFNGSAANIDLDYIKIPVLGGVEIV